MMMEQKTPFDVQRWLFSEGVRMGDVPTKRSSGGSSSMSIQSFCLFFFARVFLEWVEIFWGVLTEQPHQKQTHKRWQKQVPIFCMTQKSGEKPEGQTTKNIKNTGIHCTSTFQGVSIKP